MFKFNMQIISDSQWHPDICDTLLYSMTVRNACAWWSYIVVSEYLNSSSLKECSRTGALASPNGNSLSTLGTEEKVQFFLLL